MEVDEAGRDDQAFGVKNFGVGGGKIRAHLRDQLAVEKDIQRGVGAACRVQQARVFD